MKILRKLFQDYDAQTRLELLHRHDEDQLYESFENERIKESEHFESETRVSSFLL